tara:strand:- start:314 stop:1207 length:894 start_codon:yes stop_codon:yes gene_type:complete
MKVLFEKGKQRELIRFFKEKNNFTWNQLADFLKIKFGRLMAYYYETSLISEELYGLLDVQNKYGKFVVDRRENNWGQSKGGKLSTGNTKKIKFPRNSSKFAEFYGIMLGDGNSSRIKSYKIGTYNINVTGDSRYDRDYLIGFVKPLVENLFDVGVASKFSNSKNVMAIISHGREIVDFLERKEFPPGNKIKNKLGIPGWIKEDQNYLRKCLRGLYDTDGSIYKLTNQNSYQVTFRNYNSVLMNDVRNGLLNLGINCSKVSGKSLYITRKSEIAKFFKLVGFKNSKHLNRIKKFGIAL